MNTRKYSLFATGLLALFVLVGCSQQGDSIVSPTSQLDSAEPASKIARGFVHGIVVNLDGIDYYMAGAPDGPGGAVDVPGHYWRQASSKLILGKHYNTGPFGAAKWWSSDAPDGILLYNVKGVIDTWNAVKAKAYASKGFMHYHEFIRVDNGDVHPTKVIWLRHVAVLGFTLDGGPAPALSHSVSPGIDYEFIPTWMKPYDGGHDD